MTQPEDVAAHERLEELRDQLQEAVAHRISRRLRKRLEEDGSTPRLNAIATDPRDPRKRGAAAAAPLCSCALDQVVVAVTEATDAAIAAEIIAIPLAVLLIIALVVLVVLRRPAPSIERRSRSLPPLC